MLTAGLPAAPWEGARDTISLSNPFKSLCYCALTYHTTRLAARLAVRGFGVASRQLASSQCPDCSGLLRAPPPPRPVMPCGRAGMIIIDKMPSVNLLRLLLDSHNEINCWPTRRSALHHPVTSEPGHDSFHTGRSHHDGSPFNNSSSRSGLRRYAPCGRRLPPLPSDCRHSEVISHTQVLVPPPLPPHLCSYSSPLLQQSVRATSGCEGYPYPCLPRGTGTSSRRAASSIQVPVQVTAGPLYCTVAYRRAK